MPFNRPTQSRTARAGEAIHAYDEGLRSYMLSVYNHMAGALGVTGVVSYLAAQSEGLMMALHSTGGNILLLIGLVIYSYMLSSRIMRMSFQKAQLAFWGFAALFGLAISWVFLAFTGGSLARVFFITAAAFGGLSLYGYTTKKDLSAWGTFLFMGAIGLLLAILVNIFMQSSALHMAISAMGVLIFSGFTAYDTQSVKHAYYDARGNAEIAQRIGILGALRLYLDFINLFIFLLQFLGDRR